MGLREAVVKSIKERGVGPTAKALGLAQETTLRLAAGAPVQPGTLALAERNMGSLRDSAPPAAER